MLKKMVEIVVCLSLLGGSCLAMEGDRDSFTKVVFDDPTGNLEANVSALTGKKARALGDALIKLYVRPGSDRDSIFKSFASEDIKLLRGRIMLKCKPLLLLM